MSVFNVETFKHNIILKMRTIFISSFRYWFRKNRSLSVLCALRLTVHWCSRTSSLSILFPFRSQLSPNFCYSQQAFALIWGRTISPPVVSYIRLVFLSTPQMLRQFFASSSPLFPVDTSSTIWRALFVALSKLFVRSSKSSTVGLLILRFPPFRTALFAIL